MLDQEKITPETHPVLSSEKLLLSKSQKALLKNIQPEETKSKKINIRNRMKKNLQNINPEETKSKENQKRNEKLTQQDIINSEVISISTMQRDSMFTNTSNYTLQLYQQNNSFNVSISSHTMITPPSEETSKYALSKSMISISQSLHTFNSIEISDDEIKSQFTFEESDQEIQEEEEEKETHTFYFWKIILGFIVTILLISGGLEIKSYRKAAYCRTEIEKLKSIESLNEVDAKFKTQCQTTLTKVEFGKYDVFQKSEKKLEILTSNYQQMKLEIDSYYSNQNGQRLDLKSIGSTIIKSRSFQDKLCNFVNAPFDQNKEFEGLKKALKKFKKTVLKTALEELKKDVEYLNKMYDEKLKDENAELKIVKKLNTFTDYIWDNIDTYAKLKNLPTSSKNTLKHIQKLAPLKLRLAGNWTSTETLSENHSIEPEIQDTLSEEEENPNGKIYMNSSKEIVYRIFRKFEKYKIYLRIEKTGKEYSMTKKS